MLPPVIIDSIQHFVMVCVAFHVVTVIPDFGISRTNICLDFYSL